MVRPDNITFLWSGLEGVLVFLNTLADLKKITNLYITIPPLDMLPRLEFKREFLIQIRRLSSSIPPTFNLIGSMRLLWGFGLIRSKVKDTTTSAYVIYG